jgi:hypothetical protein
MLVMRRLKKNNRTKGQGVVEFALVLPVLLMLVFGLIEFGRLLFIYITINSAAREAARYGISVGDGNIYINRFNEEVVTERFYDCDGIRAAAKNIGKFAGLQDGHIAIYYDHGPSSIPGDKNNDGWPVDVNGNVKCYWLRRWYAEWDYEPTPVKYGDRIKVRVTIPYSPIISYLFLDIPTIKMDAYANRTIVRNAKVAPGPDP